MSLVNAESDEGFVAEVSDGIRRSCTQMNEQVSAMIEEYLRRRVEQAQMETKQEYDVQIRELEENITALKHEKMAAEEGYAVLKMRRLKTAEALERSNARANAQGCFLRWRTAVRRRRGRRQLAEEMTRRTEQLAIYHVFSQWRLFAAVRRNAHLEAAETQKRDHREQELMGQLEEYQRLLQEAEHKNEQLDEKLKDAFVRGMCALNREAVQVLHGSDTYQEDDVEAIADILSRDTRSRRQSEAQGKVEESMQSSNAHPSICPVHQVDSSGNFYHRCYAPGYCHYDARHSRPRTPPSSNTTPAPPTPFVVRADPQAVRSFNAGSSVVPRQPPKPTQARWKL